MTCENETKNNGKEPEDWNLYSESEGSSEVTETYKGFIRRKSLFLGLTSLLLLFAIVASANMGTIEIAFKEVLIILLTFDNTGIGRIIWDVRMPKIMAAVLIGAGLSISGAVMQSILRNPLASPYTLGLSSAAAFGASFAIVFLQAGTQTSSSVIINNPYIVTISAFCFSMLATLIILLLTKLTSITAETMVLAGIAIGSIFAAGLTLMQYLADSVQLSHIVSWTFGDLGRANWELNFLMFVALVPVAVFFIYNRWNFNAMDAGEETAKGLGIETGMLRAVSMVAATFISALMVSFFGIIAFIGLLGPHIARRIVGSDHRHLLPASMLVGGLILLTADTVSRTILLPMVLPVGIMTSMLGGPLFIYLLLKRRRV